MDTKLNLKLEIQNQRKFAINQKDFKITYGSNKIDQIPWINLFVIIEDIKISFFLDMYPMAKSSLKYRKIDVPPFAVDGSNIDFVVNHLLFSEEMELVPNGFPWSYANRKQQFKDIGNNTPCIIFWCGAYEIRINRTYQFFDNIIEMLKRP